MHVPAKDRVSKFIAATITITICGLALVLFFSKPGFSEEIKGWHFVTNYQLSVRWSETVVHDGYLYVAGGKQADNNATNIVRYAKIEPDGALAGWQPASPLPGNRYLHSMVADSDYLYLLGGWEPEFSTPYQDAWRAPFLTGGELGSWEPLGNLPVPIYIHDAVIVNGYIYLIGGYGGESGEETLDGVYSAEITPGGLGSWTSAPVNLPLGLRGHKAVAHNNRIYVTGGFDRAEISQTAVYVAEALPDGKLTGWDRIAELEQPTHYHQALIHNNQLVILGGTNRSSSSPHYTQVYSASIGNDGRLGEWVVKPSFNPGMSSFAAAVSTRDNSEFIYTVGGESSSGVLRKVLMSAPLGLVPPPPIPPGLDLILSNDPQGWPAPGEEITYTIRYDNPGAEPITGVELNGWIPENTELVDGSITDGNSDDKSFTGFQPGDQITWVFDEIGPEQSGAVSYTILRPLQPTSSSALVEIGKRGPQTVDPGDPITYSLSITSTLAQSINNLVVKDRLPERATYISGGTLGDDGYVQWEIPILSAFSTATVEFVVTANQSLINSDYRAVFDKFPDAVGRNIVITRVGNTDLPPEGDGTVITNSGASAIWTHAGQQATSTSNPISNPSFSIYLPTISR